MHIYSDVCVSLCVSFSLCHKIFTVLICLNVCVSDAISSRHTYDKYLANLKALNL